MFEIPAFQKHGSKSKTTSGKSMKKIVLPVKDFTVLTSIIFNLEHTFNYI